MDFPYDKNAFTNENDIQLIRISFIKRYSRKSTF